MDGPTKLDRLTALHCTVASWTATSGVCICAPSFKRSTRIAVEATRAAGEASRALDANRSAVGSSVGGDGVPRPAGGCDRRRVDPLGGSRRGSTGCVAGQRGTRGRRGTAVGHGSGSAGYDERSGDRGCVQHRRLHGTDPSILAEPAPLEQAITANEAVASRRRSDTATVRGQRVLGHPEAPTTRVPSTSTHATMRMCADTQPARDRRHK